MQFHFAGWEFRVSAIPALATLVLFPLLMALGFWQLGRAEIKAEQLTLRSQRSEHHVLDLARLGELRAQDRYREVEGRGQYLVDRQILLDNRTHAGQAGYHVLTPVLLEAGTAVLVNRGWIALGGTREVLPALPAPQGEVVVRGILDRPPRPGLRLGEGIVAKSGWPMVVLEVDFDDLSNLLDSTLVPALVLLDPDEPGGFVRHWEPDREFGPDRHRGYAAQWFLLAAALLVIFIVVNVRRVGNDSR